MKISLALGQRQTLSRQTAWGCLTSNLAVPGFGSLAAGHSSGYFQVALTVIGMALTMIFGARFVLWMLANWTRLHDPMADQFDALGQMWLAVRWALLGIGIFGFAWLWALVTSLAIVRSAAQPAPSTIPPRLN